MIVRCNIITLAILGIFDLKKKWIPNVILLGWVLTIIVCTVIVATPISLSAVALSLVVVGIFFPMRQIVECCAGDFKLYAVLMMTQEPEDSLLICLISMIFGLFPLASGIKMVPMAMITFLGYVTFLFLRMGEVI